MSAQTPVRDGRTGILALGPEIVLSIMEMMRPSDTANLARARKVFMDILLEHQSSVSIKLLMRLPEFETLLYVYTATRSEMNPKSMLRPRVVYFDNGKSKKKLMDRTTENPAAQTTAPIEITLGLHDISELWYMARTVDWWVDYFPGLRWRDAPEDRRCLREAEESRLRKAVAHWWLYARHHHGWFGGGRDIFQPIKWSDDTRLQIFRRMSTSEIHELTNLWDFVRETVSRDLCSSPGRVCSRNGAIFELVPWTAGGGLPRHAIIVKTYMKLDPEQLRYFLKTFSYWQKTFTISAAVKSMEYFSIDTETLWISTNRVLQERVHLNGHLWNDVPHLGILDEDRDSDDVTAEWANDAMPSGLIPSDVDVTPFPADLPHVVDRGNDGSDLHHWG
ncbi:hypothetical protein GGS26DRAFT_595015 [Hypomontagnella submonticulosa]|nr:hypothetical protein GGS26DRAFT_595015 [Hypomontagnella submonticulosa]